MCRFMFNILFNCCVLFSQVAVLTVAAGPVCHVSVHFGLSHDALCERPTPKPPSDPQPASVPAHMAGPRRETRHISLSGGEKVNLTLIDATYSYSCVVKSSLKGPEIVVV